MASLHRASSRAPARARVGELQLFRSVTSLSAAAARATAAATAASTALEEAAEVGIGAKLRARCALRAARREHQREPGGDAGCLRCATLPLFFAVSDRIGQRSGVVAGDRLYYGARVGRPSPAPHTRAFPVVDTPPSWAS